LATAERIIIVCGGDYPLLASLYNGCEIAIEGIVDVFIPVPEKASEAFREICEMFDDVLIETTWDRPKWYNPIDRHNYRKIHHITPKQVVKRRDRQRESRRSLDGLSPKNEIIDTDPEELEVIVS